MPMIRTVSALVAFASASALVAQSGRTMAVSWPPVLGGSTNVLTSYPVAAAGNLWTLLWSSPFAGTASLTVPGFSVVGLARIDLGNFIATDTRIYDASGTASYAVGIPNDPLLLGLSLDIQTIDLAFGTSTLYLADNDYPLVVGVAQARPSDPVVMTGANVAPMLSTSPGEVLAFRYTAANGTWTQVPVQIDERANYTVRDCYNGGYYPLGVVEYTDVNTWVGADPDPTFDTDDEIVFMAFDTGDQAPAGTRPAGVAASPAAQVTVTDTLNGHTGRLYLFKRTNPALDPSAGRQYVSYQFRFGSSYQYGSADYRAQYDLGGAELEDSTITGLDANGSPVYRTHFQKKWIRDNLQIYKGGASGADILDIDQAEWAGGTCSRSVNTFSNAESCFAINKSGPVRALRQYYGANSGWAMGRTHEFYQSLEIERVNFRLHSGVGIQAYMDHNPNAYGMRYYNDQTLAGVTVDGVPDTVGALTQWAMIAATVAGGNQGSYSQHFTVQTNLPDLIIQGVYDDNGNNSALFSNCYGTTAAIAIGGVQMLSGYCTDPYAGQASCTGGWYYIPGWRRYFETTGMTVSQAQQRDAWTRTPLTAGAVPF